MKLKIAKWIVAAAAVCSFIAMGFDTEKENPLMIKQGVCMIVFLASVLIYPRIDRLAGSK